MNVTGLRLMVMRVITLNIEPETLNLMTLYFLLNLLTVICGLPKYDLAINCKQGEQQSQKKAIFDGQGKRG